MIRHSMSARIAGSMWVSELETFLTEARAAGAQGEAVVTVAKEPADRPGSAPHTILTITWETP